MKLNYMVNTDYDGRWVIDKYHLHDAWLHWNLTERCNLNCAYCFSHNSPARGNAELPVINIPALIKTLDKTNKIFKVRFTGGGEPFLVPNIVEACVEITKKHYVGANTNLTCDNIQEFANRVDPEKVTNINASIHIKELERNNLIEKVIRNFLLCKAKGFNIVASVIAYPPLLHEAEKYINFFKEKGIKINFSFFIGMYNNKEYPKSHTEEEIKVFGLNRIWLERHYKYRGICNAGFNVGMVKPNGDLYPCNAYFFTKIGNVYKIINFKKRLVRCPLKYCTCPLKQLDPFLFKQALEESSTRKCSFWHRYFLTRTRGYLIF